MANFDISYFVRLRDQFAEPGKKVAAVAVLLNKKFEALEKTVKNLAPKMALLNKVVTKSKGQLALLGVTLPNVTPKLNKFATTALIATSSVGSLAATVPRVPPKLNMLAIGTDRANKKIRALSFRIPKLKRDLKGLGQTAGEVGRKMTTMGQGMLLKVSAPLALIGGFALVQSAKLETLSVSFETMTGSASAAKDMMQKVTSFTATTPFQLEGVAGATKQLLAFGVTQKDMIPKLRMLGDISAGAGVPLKDMAQIFGKAKAKGKLMTEEILQMAERGIPVVSVLAKGFGVTKQKIFEMASKSQISFGVMQQALKSMTTKGGIFFDQTKRQSETLAGRWSTLKDNFKLSAAAIGDVVVKSLGLNKMMEKLNNIMVDLPDRIKAFGEANPFIVKMMVAFAGFLFVMGPIVFVLGQIGLAISGLILIAPLMGKAFALATGPVGTLITTFMLAFAAGQQLMEMFKTNFPDAYLAFSDKMGNVIGHIVDAVRSLKAALGFNVEGLKSASGVGARAKSRIRTPAVEAAAASTAQSLGAVSPITGTAAPVTNQSQHDINVNLNAPEGVVQSIKTRSSSRSAARVGVNMRTG